MIPKTIHWCWFSGEPLSDGGKECRDTWAAVLPDYEVVLWDMAALEKMPLPRIIRTALSERNWALVSDYARLYAVYEHGGVYLDSDVLMKKPFTDEMLSAGFFSATEFPWETITGLQAAVFGAEKGHPFLAECMRWYKDISYEAAQDVLEMKIIAPRVYADVAKGWGFSGDDVEQRLRDGMTIYPHYVLAGFWDQVREETVALHVCHGYWRPEVRERNRKRVMLAIPYTKFIETQTWESILNLERPENTVTEVRTYARYSCAMARNTAAKDAVAGGFDYLFFVDSDMILPADALVRLLRIDADFATGWAVWRYGATAASIATLNAAGRVYEGMHMDWVVGHTEPFAVDGSGLSCTLVKTEVFKELEYPYFKYVEYADSCVLSEDFYFCELLNGKGKKIICDPALRVGHIKHVVA